MIKNNQIQYPMDVITIYNLEIMNIYNIYKEKIENDNITPSEHVKYIKLLTNLYKSENEELGLSFYDKRGNRYMNYLLSSPYDTFKHCDIGNIDQISSFLLNRLKKHFSQEHEDRRKELLEKGYTLEQVKEICMFDYRSPLENIAPREAAIISLIFGKGYGSKVIKKNFFDYDIHSRYHSEEEKEYCEAILNLIREIAIRTWNFTKYIYSTDEYKEEYTNEEVKKLYKLLYENFINDKEYINKGPVGRCLQKIKYNIKLHFDDE